MPTEVAAFASAVLLIVLFILMKCTLRLVQDLSPANHDQNASEANRWWHDNKTRMFVSVGLTLALAAQCFLGAGEALAANSAVPFYRIVFAHDYHLKHQGERISAKQVGVHTKASTDAAYREIAEDIGGSQFTDYRVVGMSMGDLASDTPTTEYKFVVVVRDGEAAEALGIYGEEFRDGGVYVDSASGSEAKPLETAEAPDPQEQNQPQAPDTGGEPGANDQGSGPDASSSGLARWVVTGAAVVGTVFLTRFVARALGNAPVKGAGQGSLAKRGIQPDELPWHHAHGREGGAQAEPEKRAERPADVRAPAASRHRTMSGKPDSYASPIANTGNPLPIVSYGSETDYRISSGYPFPLAFGFRSLMSIVDYRDLYRQQLRIAENMLAFLASVSLTLLREHDRRNAVIDPREYWRSGISPGDWKDIVGRCGKVFAAYENNPLALRISKLNIRSEKKGFGQDVAKLIQAKNDFKHDRGPTVVEDMVEASQEAQERLRRCMEELSFLADHPIRQVEDFDVSRSGDTFYLKCLRYMGDHPSFPQEEVVFHRGLRKGDLYLELDGRNWVSLYPFVVPMTCSHCKVRETYFIDLWDTKRGVARMKSFERGHTMSSSEVSESLAQWDRGAGPPP